MIWISLFETLLLAAVIPAVLANRHQNRSDGKWKLHENHRAHEVLQDSSSALLPGSSNHSYAISQRISSENKSNDEWQHGNPESEVTCEEARLKCAYRVGCGMALQSYVVGCSDVITGASQRCSDHCRNALIALTSTEEGEALMKCKCGDAFCQDSKQRITICRNAVLSATNTTSPVSCSVAQWICSADPLCSTALEYYNRFCRSMFAGKKCTSRCKNSISILRRQEKAAKLTSCVCDGTEDYDCPSILDNMNRLCRLKPYVTTTEPPKVTTQRTTITTTPAHRLETGMGGGLGVAGRKNNTKKNELDQVGNVTQTTGQLPRHPTTEMPENCGKTNGQTLICSPDVNEENNDATVTLNSIHVSDRSSATSVLASFFLLPSSLAVLGLLRGARFTFLHST